MRPQSFRSANPTSCRRRRPGLFAPGNAGSTGAGPFTRHQTEYTLWIFSVSPMLNIMHLIVGALAVLAARRTSGTALFSLAATVWFAGINAYSILVVTIGSGDRLNLNWATVILQLVTMLAAIVMLALSFREGDQPADSERDRASSRRE
ncbi:DUF4383 domain-containing protein [Amycolatopsis sp. NPDC049253]|uniref:DUF4383 domain-containing protein n=1 Tax=Amycolatopsis sp. NPDC049253 TaxID=3155274 RepID=UPI003426FF11